jgi:hypothetical protein
MQRLHPRPQVKARRDVPRQNAGGFASEDAGGSNPRLPTSGSLTPPAFFSTPRRQPMASKSGVTSLLARIPPAGAHGWAATSRRTARSAIIRPGDRGSATPVAHFCFCISLATSSVAARLGECLHSHPVTSRPVRATVSSLDPAIGGNRSLCPHLRLPPHRQHFLILTRDSSAGESPPKSQPGGGGVKPLLEYLTVSCRCGTFAVLLFTFCQVQRVRPR